MEELLAAEKILVTLKTNGVYFSSVMNVFESGLNGDVLDFFGEDDTEISIPKDGWVYDPDEECYVSELGYISIVN